MNNKRFEEMVRFMAGCTANGEVVGNTVREAAPKINPVVEVPILHVVEEEVALPSWCKSHATGIKREPLLKPEYIKY